jgi:GntR family transcriptional regulator of vanillate catabolism
MITQAEVVLLKLREMLLSGAFQPGEHLMEVPLAQRLNVSRTPVRLALGALAQEGLLRYTAKSGFAVRGFSVKEIVDAVAVRGRLEAMACRLAAEKGLEPAAIETLRANVERTQALAGKKHLNVDHVRTWCELNGEFHDTLVREAGNESLSKFVQQVDSIPLASAKTIAATMRNLQRIGAVIDASVAMHRLVLDAVERRQPERADHLMLEHVYQGQLSLQRYLETLGERPAEAHVPSLKLVAG